MISNQLKRFILDVKIVSRGNKDRIHKSINTAIKTTANLTNKCPSNLLQQQSNSTMSENPSATDNKVFVQHNLAKNMMRISFDYMIDGKTKSFNLQRDQQEHVAAALERIKLNLCKMKKTKDKLRDSSNSEENVVVLAIHGVNADISQMQNIDAWVDGAILNINNISYEITTNSPQVESIKLPGCMMKGFFAVPNISLTNCDLSRCKISWFRQILAKQRDNLNDDDKERLIYDSRHFWLKMSDEFFYRPTDDDVACQMRVSCTPSDGIKNGPTISSETTYPVQIGPSKFPFEERHLLTQRRLGQMNEFRVVSYNILADLYADSDYSRSVLFGHCPPFALEIDYRKQILLKEISGYNADLICLQEVDRKEYEKTYNPFFKYREDLIGIFDTKGGQVAEGAATFFRNEKFELIESHKTLLSQLIDPDYCQKTELAESSLQEKLTAIKSEQLHPILSQSAERARCLTKFDQIRLALQANGQLKKRFMDRHTIIQTTLLKVKGLIDQFIIVANTHLYFAPDADHIRLLQGSVCVKYLEFIKDYSAEHLKRLGTKKPTISIIFCGDMNSTPDCGLYSLVTTGFVTDSLPDWTSNEEESVVGLSLDTDLRFSSAYENIPYTNYTMEFNGCLDYIYYERETISCKNIIPLPKHEVVTAIGGLPSDVFPSDHLALIADLKLIK